MLYYDCGDDLFENTYFENEVKETIREVFSEGTLGNRTNPAVAAGNYTNIYLDLEAIYKGIVAAWCMESGKKETVRSLSENMEHVIYRFLLSFASDATKVELRQSHFVRGLRHMTGKLNLSGVNIAAKS